MPTLIRIFGFFPFIIFCYFIVGCIHTKKRRLRYCSSTREGLRTYPFSQINNNETYADMTKRRLLKQPSEYECHTRRHLLVTLLLTESISEKKCSKLFARQIQSVNKRHSICNEPTTIRRIIRLRRKFGCKITKNI